VKEKQTRPCEKFFWCLKIFSLRPLCAAQENGDFGLQHWFEFENRKISDFKIFLQKVEGDHPKKS
jgi:hypothetical protein